MKCTETKKAVYYDGTQKEIVSLLSEKYGKSKSFFDRYIRESRKAGYIWNDLPGNDPGNIVYLVPGKMYVVFSK